MASSLVLPFAESLSGQWTVTDKSNSCIIQLSAESVESVSGYRLNVSPNCVHPVLPEATMAWRPSPDGIALLDSDGLTVLFFSWEGEHYRSQIWDNSGKVLKRIKK